MSASLAKKIEKLSFEQALEELEHIVKEMESGQVDLDKAIDSYTTGMALKNHCEKKLSEAKLKIEKIEQQPDGSLGTVPFEAETPDLGQGHNLASP